jgi:hypothetical protein
VERIRDGARLVPAKLDRLKSSARSGRASSAVFSAAELNGYLASQAEGPGPATVDIEVRAGAFELRGTRTLRPLAWLPVPALAGTALRVTYDLTGTFAQGRLNVTRVRIGHLPCVGPLRALPLGWLASVCDPVVNDRELVEAVRDVTLEANRAEVIVGR